MNLRNLINNDKLHYEVPVKCCVFPAIQPQSAQHFAEEADLCPELEESTVCRDYPIRTISASLEKPHYFYAEPIRNPTLRIISPLRL